MCITSNCPVGTGVCDPTIEDKWVNVKVCYDHPLIVGLPWLDLESLDICSETKMRIAQ
jgi:hypothetical protein